MREYNLDGLVNINVELTSRCNKNCWMCGRRRVEKDYPALALEYGDMDFSLLEKIATELPPNIVVQFHYNGESLLYPRFGEAVKLFKYQIKKEFLRIKGNRKPFTILRLNGDVNQEKYKEFGLIMATRILHSPLGSFNYIKSTTIPEIGICLDFLNHLAINHRGKVSICVRFDPKGVGVIGDVNDQSLSEIWNSPRRLAWLSYHKQGQRDQVPLCSYCHFWGVPTGKILQKETVKINEENIFSDRIKS